MIKSYMIESLHLHIKFPERYAKVVLLSDHEKEIADIKENITCSRFCESNAFRHRIAELEADVKLKAEVINFQTNVAHELEVQYKKELTDAVEGTKLMMQMVESKEQRIAELEEQLANQELFT